MRSFGVLAVIATVLSCSLVSPAASKKPIVQVPAPAVEPDWSVVREQSESAIRSNLIDPDSAQIKWTHGFKWGFYDYMHRRTWAWLGCGEVNAKNRMGGYSGATSFIVAYDGGVKYSTIDEDADPYGLLNYARYTCMHGGFPSPQPALLAKEGVSTPSLSIADELAKLAGLRDKGVITEAEFEARKKKLLEQ